MQKNTTEMPTFVVRYPKPAIGLAIGFMFIPAAGMWMAIAGKEGWTFWHVAFFATLGSWCLLYVLLYRTLFSVDGVELRRFPRPRRAYRYMDIAKVELRSPRGSWGLSLFLFCNDGRQVQVIGPLDQLTQVQTALAERIPHAFEKPTPRGKKL
jgi:hypothetical protein